jgi:predicted nuclease with RNAse H fold
MNPQRRYPVLASLQRPDAPLPLPAQRPLRLTEQMLRLMGGWQKRLLLALVWTHWQDS